MNSTILDVNGKPFDMQASTVPQTAQVGYLRLEFDRHPARGLTPARLQRIMEDAERGDLVGQLELAEDMEERDAHLFAEISKRRGAVTSLAWSIEPPKNATPEETQLTEDMRTWFSLIEVEAAPLTGGIELMISTMTDAILKSFAPQEMVWTMVGGARIPRLTAQPQRWFCPSADRRRLMLRSMDASTESTDGMPAVAGTELLPLSWLMHVHPAKAGYVSRMSLARVLFWPYLFKNYSVRDLAEFLEIYGLPLRLGKYPAGASDVEKRRLLQAVVEIGHNAAGIIPAGMELDFEAAAAGTEVPFVAMWDHMDAAESKAILGQTLTASEGQHGTQALGQVHDGVRMDIRNDDARRIENTVNRQLIRPLALLNREGAAQLRLPTFKLDTGEADDVQVYADNLPKLADAGLRIGTRFVYDKLRIPEPAEGEEILQATGVPAPSEDPADTSRPLQKTPVKPTALTGKIAGQPAGEPSSAARDSLDDVIDDALSDWRPLLGPMVTPLVAEMNAAVKAGETLESFAARLPQLIERMDSRPLGESLARATFVAQLAGDADLDLPGQDE